MTEKETPALSASIARTLITKAPKHAWLEHRLLGGKQRKASSAMDVGSLRHKILLGKGADIVPVDAEDWRTKAAKEARDTARAAGKIPVLFSTLNEANEAAAEIRRHLHEFGISLDGESEVELEWDEHGVLCHGQIDHLQGAMILELKMSSTADPRKLRRHIVDMGYDIQQAAYESAVSILQPELAGRTRFLWLFCEMEEPWCVSPLEPDGEMRMLGEARWRKAVQIWDRCLRSGRWPGYVDGIAKVGPMPWALEDAVEADDSGEELVA